MPIRQFVGTTPLGPADLDAMNKAFTAALAKLGLSNLKDPMAEAVARRIIDAALASKGSTNDPNRDDLRLRICDA